MLIVTRAARTHALTSTQRTHADVKVEMFGAVEKHKDAKEALEYKLKLEENAALAKAESFSFAKSMEEGGGRR